MPFIDRNGPAFGDRGEAKIYAGEAVAVAFRLLQPDGDGWTGQDLSGRVFVLRVFGELGETLTTVEGEVATVSGVEAVSFGIAGEDTAGWIGAKVQVRYLGWEMAEVVETDRRRVLASKGLVLSRLGASAVTGSEPGSGGAPATLYELRTDGELVLLVNEGAPGLSAYQFAVLGGFEGTAEEFADALAANAIAVADNIAAINAAGTTQTGAVNTAGATQLSAVNGAGTTQVAAVNAAGTSQTSAVNAAGATQVSAVEGAGATQVSAVNAAGSTQTSAVNTAGATQVVNVNTAGSTQTAAVNAAGDAQVEVLETRAGELADALDIAGGELVEVVGPAWGFDAGDYAADKDGWTHEDFYRGIAGQIGNAVVRKTPGADWSGKAGAFRVWKYPLWSLEPTAFLKASSIGASGGRHMANSLSATPPSDNLFAFPSADLRLVSTSQMTRTRQYSAGPSGGPEDDTLRIQYTANNTVVSFINRVIPAGTWDISVLARGVTPATTWDIRRGATGSLTADTVSDTAFKLLERAAGGVVSDGVANTDFRVLGTGSNQPDIEYTQLQGFPLGQKPSWADEMADTPFNWHFKKQWSFAGSITTDGNGELIMTGGENFGFLFPAGFPDPLSVSDLVLHLMVDVTSAAANTRMISTESSSGDATISPATTNGTLYLGCGNTDGLLAAGPVNTGSSGANINLVNAGPMIITLVHKGGFRGVWVDGVPVNVLNTAVTTYAIRVLQCFGTGAGAGSPGGTCIGIGVRFNQSPDAAMIAADVLKMQYEFASAWARGGTRNKFAYSGDSVWAGFTGTQGPSAAFVQGNLGYHSRPLPTINRALSGSNIARMRTRFLNGQSDINPATSWIYGDKQLHEAGRAAGNNMIFAFDTSFANDQARFGVATVASLIADTQELAAWGRAATGNPTIIMGAIDANIATSDTRAGRDIYETAMLDGSDPDGDYVYVSLADTTLWTWNPTDFDDNLHLFGNSPGNGHDKAKAPLHDAINSQLKL